MNTLHRNARRCTRLILLLIVLLGALSVRLAAQQLSLTEAHRLLADNYPNLQTGELNDRLLELDLDLLDLERRPQLSLNGQATLQSETTNFGDAENLPISIDLPLYNVKTYGELNYTLYDGGRLTARKNVALAEGKLANQELAVEAFGLRERINQLFLRILLSRERLRLFETTLADIRARKATLGQAVALGAALESELLQLEVREVEILADRDDLNGTIRRLIANLSTLTGRALTEDVELTLPDLPELTAVPELNRPEFELFDLRRSAILANEELIEVSDKPRVSAFLQAGLGLPNPVNLFDNGIAPYAIGGVNFRWNFKDWGRKELQKQQLRLRVEQLEAQRETLAFNLESGNEAYLADVARLREQLARDREIVDLQARILTQLGAQLDNGVITADDYLAQSNAELRARQQLSLRQTELQQLQLNFLNERGAF